MYAQDGTWTIEESNGRSRAMHATQLRAGIEIDAPDGAAAVDLEQRLWYLAPTVISRGERWFVELPDAVEAEEITPIVRHWLHDIGELKTAIRVDGRPMDVTQKRAAYDTHHRGTHGDFIG
jgi:hypothetical protein